MEMRERAFAAGGGGDVGVGVVHGRIEAGKLEERDPPGKTRRALTKDSWS
jgi:hypothetical protein